MFHKILHSLTHHAIRHLGIEASKKINEELRKQEERNVEAYRNLRYSKLKELEKLRINNKLSDSDYNQKYGALQEAYRSGRLTSDWNFPSDTNS
jgi:hypothetical protein